MTTTKVEIRLATEEDNETINKQFNDHFIRDEPLNKYMERFKSPYEHRQFLQNHGQTLIAEVVDPLTGERNFAGFLMCEICDIDHPVTPENFVLRTDYRVGYEIFRIMDELDTRYNVFDVYQVRQAFDMLILSVAEEFRGKSIGYRLCQAALDLAASRGFRVAFADCTSYYSAMTVEKLGMECMGSISYEKYQREKGKKLFKVTEPHTHIKRFVQINKV